MNIEKMNEQISRLEGQKAEYNEHMDKKIIAMKKEKEAMISAQMQHIFRKHKLDPDVLIKLRFASKEQLQMVLDFINSEIEEPAKPEPKETSDDKKEKENQNHAKELNT